MLYGIAMITLSHPSSLIRYQRRCKWISYTVLLPKQFVMISKNVSNNVMVLWFFNLSMNWSLCNKGPCLFLPFTPSFVLSGSRYQNWNHHIAAAMKELNHGAILSSRSMLCSSWWGWTNLSLLSEVKFYPWIPFPQLLRFLPKLFKKKNKKRLVHPCLELLLVRFHMLLHSRILLMQEIILTIAPKTLPRTAPCVLIVICWVILRIIVSSWMTILQIIRRMNIPHRSRSNLLPPLNHHTRLLMICLNHNPLLVKIDHHYF